MRALSLVATLLSALVPGLGLALPTPSPSQPMSAPSPKGDIARFHHNIETATATFTLSHRITAGQEPADDALVFEVHVPTTDGDHGRSSENVVLNGQPLHLAWEQDRTESIHAIPVADTAAGTHTANVFVRGSTTQSSSVVEEGGIQQNFHFHLLALDGEPVDDLGFELVTQSSSLEPLRMTIKKPSLGVVEFDSPVSTADSFADDWSDEKHDHDDFNLAEQADSLRLLEIEATALQSEIIAKKQAINDHLKHHRSQKSLKYLIDECDGLVCAAKAVAQRICDTLSDHSTGYATMSRPKVQQLVATSVMDEKAPIRTFAVPQLHSNATGSAHAAGLPLILTQTGASTQEFKDLVNPSSPLVRALEILAAVLGLIALYTFIRQKCMSMRKRVEQAADREERRNARAYRRAARRAYIRQRWDSFVASLNCFRPSPQPRVEDYEEKRALILQEAFLEQMDDIDQAEKGQIMEAEIRELRHAHEIVASLIRVGHENDTTNPYAYASTSPLAVRDPPPSCVPLPFTPAPRSRASTTTLPPSYTSETLPDYTSRPATLAASSIVGGYTASTRSTLASHPASVSGDEDGDSLVSPPSSTSDHYNERRTNVSSVGRCTPTSSIVDVSPRPSDETIRTMLSRDTPTEF